jgi:hypothetical protein
MQKISLRLRGDVPREFSYSPHRRNLREAMGELAHRVVDVIGVPRVEANRGFRVFPSTVTKPSQHVGDRASKRELREIRGSGSGRWTSRRRSRREVEKEENVGATECQVKLVK